MTNTEIKKRQLGQFFTTGNSWLRPQVFDFILSINAKIAFDPFAGDGHLLELAQNIGIKEVLGFDIDSLSGWENNDSLKSIPEVKDSIIITNPPYLTNFSAKRRGIYTEVAKYFEKSQFVDLYQLAIAKCLENNEFVVAIIPETFINSDFPKERLLQVTILEENPFEDTECPVCVACFDGNVKSSDKIGVYKNNTYLGNLGYFESQKIKPKNTLKVRFNTPSGKIALRAVDMQKIDKKIEFLHTNKLDYNMKKIKESSRLVTVIEVNDIPEEMLDEFINVCNIKLEDLRDKTQDVILSPFKGNNKKGVRRRRLDYLTARAILEDVYLGLFSENLKQRRLFNE